MKTPILHNRTQLAIDLYLKSPSHAIILIGPEGIGKKYVARWISYTLNLNVRIITPESEKKSISIDQIRALYTLTRSGNNMAIIVPDSHLMSVPSQNAFLKILEEAPSNVYFILTATSSSTVLSTIKSRSQIISILPPALSDLLSYTNIEEGDRSLRSLALTTEKLPGRFTYLQSNPDQRKQHEKHIIEAKTFYSSDKYSRHIMCISENYDKEWISSILKALSIIIESVYSNSDLSKNQLLTLSKQVNLINEASNAIYKYNGNPKIHTSRLIEQW